MQHKNTLLTTINKYLIHIVLFGFVAFGLYKVIGIGIHYGGIYAFTVAGMHLPLLLFSYAYFAWADAHYGVHYITALAIISTGANSLLI